MLGEQNLRLKNPIAPKPPLRNNPLTLPKKRRRQTPKPNLNIMNKIRQNKNHAPPITRHAARTNISAKPNPLPLQRRLGSQLRRRPVIRNAILQRGENKRDRPAQKRESKNKTNSAASGKNA